MKIVREKPNGKYDLKAQGREFDLLLEEAKRIKEGAQAQAKELDGNTKQRAEHKVGPARGENK